jgi:hypothetical protein
MRQIHAESGISKSRLGLYRSLPYLYEITDDSEPLTLLSKPASSWDLAVDIVSYTRSETLQCGQLWRKFSSPHNRAYV